VQLAASVAAAPDDGARLTALFRSALGRDPNLQELELALGFLQGGSIAEYAQVLLSTNEGIFRP
jgi:hypothetical protein